MAKTKQPDNESRPGLDYYEYKQMQETARLRRRALEANLYEAQHKIEPARKSKMRVVAKIADEVPATPSASEDLTREHAMAAPPPMAPPPPAAAPVADAVEDVQVIYQDPGDLNAGSDKGYDESDVEITNPFADALSKIRQISGRLLKRRDRQDAEVEAVEYDDENLGASESPVSQETMRTKAARLKKAGRPGITLALSQDDDDDGDLDRRSRRKAAQAVHAVSSDVDDDPLGVMRPYSEEGHKAYMRPSAEDDDLHRSVTRASKQQQRNKDVAALSEASLTAKLLDDLESIPALSRRERKELASAGTLSKPATRKPVADDAPAADADPVDEPTQQFKPLRYRIAKPAAREVQREVERIPPSRIPAPVDDDDDDDFLDDEDEDDEDDFAPQAPPRRFGRKRRVYRDEEYDSDEDDEYDDEDDYDSDYDEDDEDYDDYDEEEALNERYHISFGKRLLALIKGLLIVVLVFLLIIVALRQLETSGRLNLDFIRDTVGQMLPIEQLLPSPASTMQQDAGEEEVPLSTDLPTPEPTSEPTFEPTADPDDSEGSPLDDFSEGDEMQGAGADDDLEGYSEFADDGGVEPLPGGLESEGAQAHASFAQFAV